MVESTHSRKKAKSAASFFAPPSRNEHIEYWEHTKYYLKELRACFTQKNRLKRVKIFVSVKKRFLVDVLIMIVAMVVMMTRPLRDPRISPDPGIFFKIPIPGFSKI